MPGGGGMPIVAADGWIPAFAGMTIDEAAALAGLGAGCRIAAA